MQIIDRSLRWLLKPMNLMAIALGLAFVTFGGYSATVDGAMSIEAD